MSGLSLSSKTSNVQTLDIQVKSKNTEIKNVINKTPDNSEPLIGKIDKLSKSQIKEETLNNTTKKIDFVDNNQEKSFADKHPTISKIADNIVGGIAISSITALEGAAVGFVIGSMAGNALNGAKTGAAIGASFGVVGSICAKQMASML